MHPQRFHGIERIVTGGQTGVDRAGLDAAIKLGIPHGGWCPRGRLAEDGTIPAQYQLTEMDSSDYARRTEQNVIDSDATLILYRVRLQGGTLLTQRCAKRQQRPLARIRLDRELRLAPIVHFLREHEVRTLNIAGPRESSHPGIGDRALSVLLELFATPGQLAFPDQP